MIKTVLPYAETAMFTAVTLPPVHYFAGLDWPWALVIGLATATVLRALIHGSSALHSR
jgi:hypothetical protein